MAGCGDGDRKGGKEKVFGGCLSRIESEVEWEIYWWWMRAGR